MRIGIFTDAYKPYISGVVTSIKTLKDGLEDLGHEVFIITPFAPKQKLETDPTIIRLKGWIVPKKGLKDFRIVPFVQRHLKKIKVLNLDVIHIHTEFSVGSLGLYAGRKLNIPIVYTLHTSYQDYTHYISKFLSKFLPKVAKKGAFYLNNRFTKRADVTIVPTKKILDKMHALKHDGTFKVLPSGIPLTPFYKSSYDEAQVATLKEKLGIQKDEFVAIVVARISREKALTDLVDAFIAFNKKHVKSKFIIVGDGPDKGDLDKYIDKLNARTNIMTIGFVKHEEVGLYYQLADVFLNASTTETQGLTYVEALAASLPIIVRYDDVFDDFVEHQSNGIFFHETAELTELLIQAYENPQMLDILKENAQKSVTQYSQENYALNLEKLYHRVINQKQKK